MDKQGLKNNNFLWAQIKFYDFIKYPVNIIFSGVLNKRIECFTLILVELLFTKSQILNQPLDI